VSIDPWERLYGIRHDQCNPLVLLDDLENRLNLYAINFVNEAVTADESIPFGYRVRASDAGEQSHRHKVPLPRHRVRGSTTRGISLGLVWLGEGSTFPVRSSSKPKPKVSRIDIDCAWKAGEQASGTWRRTSVCLFVWLYGCGASFETSVPSRL